MSKPINVDTLHALFTSLSLAFNQGLAATTALWPVLAMEIPSTGADNKYPRLDEFPGMREWIGDRYIKDLSKAAFAIENRSFEMTIGIPRPHVEDDQLGLYGKLAEGMGSGARTLPDKLIFGLLKRGDKEICWDGQNFFDADHPGFNSEGKETSVSNIQPGDGPAWFLIDDSQILKPMIWQPRRKFEFVAKQEAKDDIVFMKDKFVYGVDGRCNAGFGMWQCAFMSKAPLTPENYAAARAAMGSIFRENGESLAITPKKLLVPPALESDARMLATSEMVGEKVGDATVAISNKWKGTVEPVIVPLLA